MTQPAKSQEPSMEEILASIRRIIADDDATNTVPPPESPHAEVAAASRHRRRCSQSRRRRHHRPRAATACCREFEPEPPPVVEEPVFTRGTDGGGSIRRHSRSHRVDGGRCPSRRHAGAPQFRTIDGNSDVGFDEAREHRPRRPLRRPRREP